MKEASLPLEAAVPYRQLVDSVPMFVAYVDADERYGFVNAKYTDLFGSDHQFVGRRISEALGQAAYAIIEPYVRCALAGERVAYEHWLDLPRGKSGYFRVGFEPQFDNEAVVGLMIHGLDMTSSFKAREAQRESQEALDVSERMYHAVFHNAAVGMARVGADGTWLEVNDGLCRMVGYSREELSRSTFQQITHADDLAADVDQAQRLLAGEIDSYAMDKRYIRKDGSILWARLTVSAVRDESDRPLYAVAVVENISARKEVEAALRDLNQELESRIEERTSELSELNKELDAFNYSVSHDLRAPLRGIDGFSQALLEDYGEKLDERGKHYLERVRRAATRMGELIDALLSLSRLTRGSLQKTRVDLCRLAHEVAKSLQDEDPSRSVSFEVAKDLYVDGDERLLKVLLRNLMENAWKFSRGKADGRIEVGCLRESNEAVLFVRDNGAGFDGRYAGKLFVPFQRLHSDEEFDGLGIGLATAQRIVNKHGGRIWAEGAVGEGATFYFTLGAAS